MKPSRAANDNPIDLTRQVWKPRLGRDLTNEDAWQINSLRFINQRFDNITPTNIPSYIISIIDSYSFKYIVTPNIDHLLKLVQDSNSRTQVDYYGADLAICDSRIVELLASFVDKRVSVCPGADIVNDLLSLTPERRHSAGVVGPSQEDVVTLAAKYPAWSFIHYPAPIMQIGSPVFEQAVEGALAGDWDVLLLCLGFPKQEAFAASLRRKGRRRGVALCVGATVDFLVGKQKRAPVFMQQARLEWMHRLFSNPRRLWRRYLLEGPWILYWYLKIEVLGRARK
jgi:N-acetylglucosaminyldiphosphoundecaprenol N-acetyl-beta-D-mannosaminyltransferase